VDLYADSCRESYTQLTTGFSNAVHVQIRQLQRSNQRGITWQCCATIHIKN